MKRNISPIMDFGSAKITVLVGEKSVNNNYHIIASGTSDYAGFMDGEFLEPNTLKYSIENAIKKAEEGYNKKITYLTIGVPGEFCKVVEQNYSLQFGKRIQITKAEIDNMLASANPISLPTHEYINSSPMYYILDDNSKTNNPIGCYSTSLKARVSVVLVQNQFLHLITSILEDIGKIEADFICSTLAESLQLIPLEDKIDDAILVDAGYITTSVAHVLGEGITDLTSFSMGGGYITADLSEANNIKFGEAEQLKRKLILSLQPTGMDVYVILGENGTINVSTKDANAVALKRIDIIASNIQSSIQSFNVKADDNAVIYLTGGGLSYLKGIKPYLTKVLNRKIVICKPRSPEYAYPDLSSIMSVLAESLN